MLQGWQQRFVAIATRGVPRPSAGCAVAGSQFRHRFRVQPSGRESTGTHIVTHDGVLAQALGVDRAARAGLEGQMPCVVWLTGRSGSGKRTIANLVEKALHAQGRHTYVLVMRVARNCWAGLEKSALAG